MRDEYLKAISLAAAPTFAIMTLLTGIFGGTPHDVVCSAAQGASPVGGMVWMYTLMTAFHSAPWLKLISVWRSGFPPPRRPRRVWRLRPRRAV
jgi:hypothetical protein